MVEASDDLVLLGPAPVPFCSTAMLALPTQGWLGTLSLPPKGPDLLQEETMPHLLALSVKDANSEENRWRKFLALLR